MGLTRSSRSPATGSCQGCFATDKNDQTNSAPEMLPAGSDVFVPGEPGQTWPARSTITICVVAAQLSKAFRITPGFSSVSFAVARQPFVADYSFRAAFAPG